MKPSRENGWDCFLSGFKLLGQVGIRRFVFMPVFLNSLVLVGLFLFAMDSVSDLNQYLLGLLPEWLLWFAWLVKIVTWIILLSFGIFIYSLLANLISAPFNALLAEAVQKRFQHGIETETTGLVQLVMQTFSREWAKLVYLVPRWLLLMLLSLVPGLNLLTAPLWLLFGGWAMTLQYTDFAAENNAMSFPVLRYRLRRNWRQVFMFGFPVYLLLAVPVVNIVLVPAAVAGGTRLWMEHLSTS